MNSHLFLQYGLRDLMVSSFPIRILVDSLASRIHASFVLFLSDPPLPQFFIILQGIAGATAVSNFLRAFLMVSLNSVSSHAIFVRFQGGAFPQATFASPSAWRAFPLISRVLAINNLAWMLAVFSSISTQTSYIRLEVFLPKE